MTTKRIVLSLIYILKKTVLGLVCVVAGIILPYLMYAESGNGNIINPVLFIMMVIAGGISFLIFAICRWSFSSLLTQVLIGTTGCYTSFILLIVIVSAIRDELPETVMWMPIMLLFGIPYMAPLVGMTCLGSCLIIENKSTCSTKNAM